MQTMVEDQRNSDNIIQKSELMGAMVEEEDLETSDLEYGWGSLFPLPNIKAKSSVVEHLFHNLKKLDLSLIEPQWEPLDFEKDLRSHLVFGISTLVNLRISPKDWYGRKFMQSDPVGQISDLYQVKLWVHSWEDKVKLPLYLFMQKGKLSNHLFRTEYPATERLSWEEWLKILAEVAQDPLPFQHTSDKHFICGDQKPNNILLYNSNKPVIYSDLKPGNCLFDGTTSNVGNSPNNSGPENGMPADGSNISSVLPQTGNKAKRNLLTARVLKVFEKANQWWHEPPHRQSFWSLKIKNESQRNVHHLLLLISSLLATITFHSALKTPGGFRVEEAYKSNCSPNNFSYLNNWFIAFNSTVFFLSIALLMRLFHELPLRPLLQISVLSMTGAYMCTMLHPLKPRSCIS